MLSRVFHTLVKRHCNSRRKVRLYLHTLLRTHKNPTTVNMRVKVHALFFDFTQLGQRKYLKSTAVCKNRLVPVHELVKSTHFVYNVIARSDVQMIGIAKLHLRFKLVF